MRPLMWPHKIEHWLKNQSLPQRLILSGGRGVFDMAINMAAELNQTQKEKIEAGIEADILCLKDNGESFRIGQEQNPEPNSARGLIEWANKTPVAAYRIVILENFERASREAPQTLLKTLEEPPPKAVFVFTTHNHHQILPTILSRMTTVVIPTNFDEFSLIPEVKIFLESHDLMKKFHIIEALDKAVKKNKNKKELLDFLENLILHARYFPQYQGALEAIFQAQKDVLNNLNPRLTLEHLALNLNQR